MNLTIPELVEAIQKNISNPQAGRELLEKIIQKHGLCRRKTFMPQYLPERRRTVKEEKNYDK